MKLFRFLVLMLSATLWSLPVRADFHDHVGMQMWSLRANTKAKGFLSSLDLVKGWGLTEVEGGGDVGDLSNEQIRAALDERGLKEVSAHVGYDGMAKDIQSVIKSVQTVGARYAICPWIPHTGPFSPAVVAKAADDFNRWGAAFKAAGIKFGYHPHGYEFVPTTGGETLFDDLVRATQPENVCYEMDVFWVFHGGGDPVKLLEKYSSRWVALHVKDIRKGAPYGQPLGHAPDTDNVAVGAGMIDWRAVLGAAERVGVTYYFIEDETPDPLANIPASLAYLKDLKL